MIPNTPSATMPTRSMPNLVAPFAGADVDVDEGLEDAVAAELAATLPAVGTALPVESETPVPVVVTVPLAPATTPVVRVAEWEAVRDEV